MPYKDKEKQRAAQLKFITNRRNSWLQNNGPCNHCGSWDELEVDHIDRSTKSMQPGAIWSRRKEVRDRELAKCQVLCHDCHLRKTISEAPKRIPNHGTHSEYASGCRCTPCTRGHASYAKKYRSKVRHTG